GDYSANDLSLREAISLANDGDTITFNSNLANQDTGFGLGTIGLTLGQLNIDKSITLDGLGANQLTVSGNSNSRVFLVDDGNDSTAIDVT
ncbi:hypothetical protein SB717_36295, partial [Priestia sp. SIMBA_032]|uniref:hypothetical protein n=1 Tax=Priestia sp. SIMBA_032 TaxID=3085775 RepID=UPI00397C9D73